MEKVELKLEYFTAKFDEKRLFAHGDFYDFLIMFDPNSKDWVSSPLSYSELLHDFKIEDIDEEEAKIIAKNKLPDDKYLHYYKLINGEL